MIDIVLHIIDGEDIVVVVMRMLVLALVNVAIATQTLQMCYHIINIQSSFLMQLQR